jgi:hypothetical protein
VHDRVQRPTAFAWAAYGHDGRRRGAERAAATSWRTRLPSPSRACAHRSSRCSVAFPVAVLVHAVGRRSRSTARASRSSCWAAPGRVRRHVVAASRSRSASPCCSSTPQACARQLRGDHRRRRHHPARRPARLGARSTSPTSRVAIAALPARASPSRSSSGELGTRGSTSATHALASVAARRAWPPHARRVASFDLRFIGQGREVQERYLFYICPLLFAGAVAWFAPRAAFFRCRRWHRRRRHRRHRPRPALSGRCRGQHRRASPHRTRYFFRGPRRRPVRRSRAGSVSHWRGPRLRPPGRCVPRAGAAVRRRRPAGLRPTGLLASGR